MKIMKCFRIILLLCLSAAQIGMARQGGVVQLRPNTYHIDVQHEALATLSAESRSDIPRCPQQLEKGFSLHMQIQLSDFTADTDVLTIPGVLTVRLRQHNPSDTRRQNYPAFTLPDGRVPVMEASLLLRLPDGCTPRREGQPEVQPMTVGLPLAMLSAQQGASRRLPWGTHDLWLNFTGITWDMYVDGQLVDRDFTLGYPDTAQASAWSKDASVVSNATLYPVPADVSAVHEKQPRQAPVQYFTPWGHNTWVGDVATIWHGGRYHVFYLCDRRGHESKFGRGGHYFEHLSTTDFLHWTEHEAATPIEEQWETFGTGTPFVWNDTLFLSYGMHTSRIYPAERTTTPAQWDYIRQHGQSAAIPFSPSPLITHPSPLIQDTPSFPSGASYSVSQDGVADFRKSHVIIHPAENPTIYTDAEGRLCMLANYGARGTWTSDQLNGGWKCLSEDFPPGGDCTFIFHWGRYDYIVGGFTHMWMKAADAPATELRDMVAAGEDFYDGLSVPSICEVDNGRYLMAGWVEIGNHWGGALVVRELLQHPDGRIGSRWVKELTPRDVPMLSFEADPSPTGIVMLTFLPENGEQEACNWQIDLGQARAQFSPATATTPEKTLREGGRPHNAVNYAIDHVTPQTAGRPITVRVLGISNQKLGGTLIDVEIDGQRTMLSYRKNLDVKKVRLSCKGTTVRHLKMKSWRPAPRVKKG